MIKLWDRVQMSYPRETKNLPLYVTYPSKKWTCDTSEQGYEILLRISCIFLKYLVPVSQKCCRATDFKFLFSEIDVVNGQNYFFSIERTGPTSNSNTYNTFYTPGSPYANGTEFTMTTSTGWIIPPDNRDLYFSIVIISQLSQTIVIWNPKIATETFVKMAIAAEQTLGTGSIEYYVSNNGTTWIRVPSLNLTQPVSFTSTSVYLKVVINGNASLSSVAWGGY